MVEGVVVAIVGSITSILGAGIGYYSSKRSSKVTERELLSKDEQAFRAELREELRVYKDEISGLRHEIVILRRENMELIAENKLLNIKVETLVARLPQQSTDTSRRSDRGWDDEEIT